MTLRAVRFFSGLVLLAAAAGAPLEAHAAQNLAVRTIAGRKYLKAQDVARYFGMRLAPVNDRYEMRGAPGVVTFTPQKRYGSFNGTVLTYDFAPAVAGGALYISASDFQNTLQALLNLRSLRNAPVRTVMLDPGHGGSDCGAVGKRFQEKVLTLLIAQRVKAHLETMGYRVLMTRGDDRTVALSPRAKKAVDAKVDLFISIHINSASNSAVRGVETFALAAPGAPSSGSGNVVYTRYPGDAALLNSTALAMSVQQALRQMVKAPDRGMKRARFVVIRENRCPAILIECGFISNRSEENLLGTASYRESLARAIAVGIRNYHLRLQKKPQITVRN